MRACHAVVTVPVTHRSYNIPHLNRVERLTLWPVCLDVGTGKLALIAWWHCRADGTSSRSVVTKEHAMQTITPHLWYDKEAREAAEFYTTLFPNSSITNVTTLHNTPSGDCDVVSFTLCGYSFQAISAGPLFTFNPSISFMVNFDPSQDTDAKTRIDAIWSKLVDGGKILMPLDAYPFSERYGWVQDK